MSNGQQVSRSQIMSLLQSSGLVTFHAMAAENAAAEAMATNDESSSSLEEKEDDEELEKEEEKKEESQKRKHVSLGDQPASVDQPIFDDDDPLWDDTSARTKGGNLKKSTRIDTADYKKMMKNLKSEAKEREQETKLTPKSFAAIIGDAKEA